MHPHRAGIALILTILALTCETSRASKQCKTVVMDVHVKNCRLGAERAKRGLERFDLQKYDEKYESKRQEGSEFLSKMKASTWHGAPQKRQLSPGQIGDIALPIVAEAMNGVTRARTYSTSEIARHQEPGPGLTGSILEWPTYYLRPSYPSYPSYPPYQSYPFSRGLTPFRTPAVNDDLDLSDEELDELYNDIYERPPRASKEEAWKVFLETASKCCQNVDRCLKEAMHVPCLGS